MNKLLLTTVIVAFAFLGFASAADYLCEPGSNMYSFEMPSRTTGSQIFLDSQNIGSSPCCETPAFNNYNVMPTTSTFTINLNNQHYVFDDCCQSPAFNNYQIETKIAPRVIYLDTFHMSEPCCTL